MDGNDLDAKTNGVRVESKGGTTGLSGVASDRQLPDRFWLIVTGLLLVTMPALTLLVAYAVLVATQSVLVGQITLVEAVELYLVEVLAFGVFGYLLYRLTFYTSRKTREPPSAEVEGEDAVGSEQTGGGSSTRT